ncbi:MAG: hypothetical protein NZ551_09550 [Microscillaceae bacterium]|nr:hypothetical protein [Microscillaceae bacterium]MDW8461445.1 hypothetical protein [Cytophagales bacterium]
MYQPLEENKDILSELKAQMLSIAREVVVFICTVLRQCGYEYFLETFGKVAKVIFDKETMIIRLKAFGQR